MVDVLAVVVLTTLLSALIGMGFWLRHSLMLARRGLTELALDLQVFQHGLADFRARLHEMEKRS